MLLILWQIGIRAPTHRLAYTMYLLKPCQCFETVLSVTEIIWNTSFRMSQPCLGFDQSQQCQFWEELLCSNAWWNCQKVVSAHSPVRLKIIIWLPPPHMSPSFYFAWNPLMVYWHWLTGNKMDYICMIKYPILLQVIYTCNWCLLPLINAWSDDVKMPCAPAVKLK